MKKLIFIKSVLLYTILFSFINSNVSKAQEQIADNLSPIQFPVPKGITDQLFYLQRDPNTNTVIYALNKDQNGDVDKIKPIHVYWLRYAEDGKAKELGYVQRKFAYGIESKEIGKDQFELRFVSHKKLPLYLSKSESDKKYHVYVTLNAKKIQVERIFLRIEGGSFWLPNVKYVEIKGKNALTNAPITARIKI